MKTIPPFTLVPKPLNKDAENLSKFKYAEDHVGTRHQLGGNPEFLQKADWPLCRDCGKRMTFYGQLDSINDEFVLADCGMIYIFVCLDCNTVESFMQSN